MLNQAIKNQFIQIVGRDRIKDNIEELMASSYDAYIVESMPDAIIFPESSQEVSKILQIANQGKIPVTARGSGTNISGGSVPIHKGVVLNFTQMNNILTINTKDRYAIVQPGVINGTLQNELAKENFFYPPDPASFTVSTIGGNVAENAGGPRCLKYGVTADYILGLEVVLASGKSIRFGSRNVKDVTGYRLAGLFCGSEGTLGIITEITLRVVPLPETKRTLLAIYNDLDNTANTVAEIIGAGIMPAAMELLDRVVINTVEDSFNLGLPRQAEGMLLIEIDGTEESVEKEIIKIKEKAFANNAVDVKTANSQAESDDLWMARRSAYGVFARIAPNCIVEDATVPVSNVPKMIKGMRAIFDKYNIRAGILAHAGDGNMHPLISTDMRNKKEWKQVEKAIKEIFDLAISLDGTLSGEHGIGLAKKDFLPLALNHDTQEFMKDIKKTVDPNNILNPGKFV